MGTMDEADTGPQIDRQTTLAARDWVVRLTSGEVGEEELARFKAWRAAAPGNALAFEQEKRFWRSLGGLREPLPVAHGAAFSRRALLVAGGGAALAASVAAMLAAPRIRDWQRSDYSTPVGAMDEFRLPDGSRAILNTDSAIDVDYRGNLRLVTLLRGEAEFQVQPNASIPFRVAACGGNSDALGTAFCVRIDGERAIVTVREGRVRVAGNEAPDDLSGGASAAVELKADQHTSYDQGGPPGPVAAVDARADLAWRDGRIIFESRPYGQAMADLARYLPERVMLAPGVDTSLPVSSIFSTSDVLAGLEALARIQGRTVHRIPGLVLLVV